MIREQAERWLAAHGDEAIAWRRHLHSHPELSHQEHQTTEFIAAKLREYGLEPHLFATGMYVDIGPDGPRVGIRGDIDALPIHELTGLPFASQHPGVMHACGHDVHATIALATACALAEADQRGKLPVGVRVIFQPAEEVMDGGAPR